MKNQIKGEKLIATNPSARANYFIEEVVEAGIVLTGTEVKSLRAHGPNLKESFVEVRARGNAAEAFLVHVHIAPYSHGNIWNHDPLRSRKLLLHRHQLNKMFGAVTQLGQVIIPTRMYFKEGVAKIEVALCKPKKKHDKRAAVQQRSDDREVSQAMKQNRRTLSEE